MMAMMIIMMMQKLCIPITRWIAILKFLQLSYNPIAFFNIQQPGEMVPIDLFMFEC